MLTQHIDMHNNTDLKCDADHYENIFRVPQTHGLFTYRQFQHFNPATSLVFSYESSKWTKVSDYDFLSLLKDTDARVASSSVHDITRLVNYGKTEMPSCRHEIQAIHQIVSKVIFVSSSNNYPLQEIELNSVLNILTYPLHFFHSCYIIIENAIIDHVIVRTELIYY